MVVHLHACCRILLLLLLVKSLFCNVLLRQQKFVALTLC